MKRLLMALGTVVMCVAPVSSAHAHDPDTLYAAQWPQTAPDAHVVVYHFTPEIGAQQRNAIRDAFSTWNSVVGSDIRFNEGNVHDNGTVDWDEPNLNCNVGNEIHWQPMNVDTTVARTKMCWNSNRTMLSFAIVFNSNINAWNYDAVPSVNQYDFQSVATHEIGHATGWWDHITGASYCPETTMCPNVLKGDTTHRTLGTHDKHTVSAKY